MSRIKNLIQEAHRRSLWQVLAIYLAGSFAALQVVEVVSNNVGLPAWTTPFAVILLVIGFPIVMATAFVQERGPVALRQASSEPAAAPIPTVRQQAAATAAATIPATPASHRRWFTWRNAMLGGAAAFTLFGVSTAGYMAMRTLGIRPFGTLVAQGVIADRAPIVIADLGSTTGDTLIARAATEALRVDLAHSPNVRVVEPRHIAEALRRMQRSPDEPLNVTLASEVAVREGVTAVVAGEINGVGRGFVMTVTMLSSHDGEVLVALRENASDSSDVIAAIDRMSKKLRERVGESFRSLRRAQPLERVTTSSLEALRMYSLGARAIDVEGDASRGIALLDEAVKLDTAFAMAHRKLAIALGNEFRERARTVEAMTRAYNHRDRLTPRERYLAEASYFSTARYDPESAIRALENMLELDSADAYALNNLGVMHSHIDEAARAEHYYRGSIRVDPNNTLAYGNLVGALVRQGKFDEARAFLELFAQRFPGNLRHTEFSAQLASSEGDYETAERLFRGLGDSLSANLGIRTMTAENLSHIAAVQGRYQDARTWLLELISIYAQRGFTELSLGYSVDLAVLDLFVRDRRSDAVARLDEALERYPLSGMHPLNRPYPALIGAYANAGHPARARALLSEYEMEVPADLRAWYERAVLRVSVTALMLAEGDPHQAVLSAAEALPRAPCKRCMLPTLGSALEALGNPDSTLAVYERYVSEPFLNRTQLLDRWHLGRVLERTAQLHDQRGDTEKAAEYYGRFIELWKNADPELQPRVSSARMRLEQLVRTRG